MTRPVLPSPARRAGVVIAWVLGGLLLLLVAAACWIGVRGVLAYQHLDSARAQVTAIRDGLDDPAAVAGRLESLQADTAAARALTGDPVWAGAESLPWAGAQLAAVSTIAVAIDDLAATSLQPLGDAARGLTLDALRPVDGRFDLETIASLQSAAQTGAAGIARAEASVSSIDSTALVTPLRTAVDEIADTLGEVAPAADALARASVLLPAMLGADGPRDYLVLVQNNAEWRSLGGIVGAMVVLHAEDGRVSLTATGSTSDFTRYDDAVVPMDAEALALFGRRPALFIQNATQIPDFTVSAPIAREMWAREFGTTVDGVLTIDPVTLSYLLSATGSVTLPTGDVLTADNAVPLLLNEVYLRYSRPADQDAFFAAASGAVFTALIAGDSEPSALIAALARAGDERRLLVWNAHEDEQAVLDGTTLQGRLPVTDAAATRFGVYVNDGTGSKMDYYLDLSTSVGWCAGPDSLAELTVTLRNTAPADAAALPDYITGAEIFGVPRGSARTVAYVYLPEGAELMGANADARPEFTGFGGGMHQGRQVQIWTTQLAPGEQSTAQFIVRTPRTPVLGTEFSPTINAAETAAVAPSCELAQ